MLLRTDVEDRILKFGSANRMGQQLALPQPKETLGGKPSKFGSLLFQVFGCRDLDPSASIDKCDLGAQNSPG